MKYLFIFLLCKLVLAIGGGYRYLDKQIKLSITFKSIGSWCKTLEGCQGDKTAVTVVQWGIMIGARDGEIKNENIVRHGGSQC